MRILVVAAPRLSVQLARRAEPGLRGRSAATVQELGGEPLVAVPSVEASAAGVQPGMTLAEARSRCPALAWDP
ncbi:MAG: DNA polymerase Y family protein, partial [Dehalococcoidia bacterium]|nr:DNA polymerase Y family protein [Dehalococcoidia bacterium]